MSNTEKKYTEVLQVWETEWENALKLWSLYTKLRKPIFCLTDADKKHNKVTDSFAQIRLTDLSVIISLLDVVDLGLENYPVEIMAHEIGHHIYCPADLTDQGRLIARVNRALMDQSYHSPLVANLYADLLINERLFRLNNLKLDEVYKKLKTDTNDKLWIFYMRIYEILWALPKSTLTPPTGFSKEIEGDAQLGNRVIKSYRDDWLKGAGRFASLCYPYLAEMQSQNSLSKLSRLFDTRNMGLDNKDMPSGLAEVDDDEIEGAVHPSYDDEGDDNDTLSKDKNENIYSKGNSGGNYREPFEYGQILKALGINLSDTEIALRYYKERALPYLIPFPKKIMPKSKEPLAEGLDTWDISSPIEEINWFESITKSPYIIPGYTTFSTYYGEDSGNEKNTEPIDLDIYVDSSGSMPNPIHNTSYLTLAGAIIALSALRVGSSVQATLWSGTNQFKITDGFVRDEDQILKILCGFYGGGTAFPIHVLRETYQNRKPTDRKVHILVISDDGVTTMFDKDEKGNSGKDIAAMALEKCGGGATLALNLYVSHKKYKDLVEAETMGFNIYSIKGWEDLIEFSRDFVKKHYDTGDKNGKN